MHYGTIRKLKEVGIPTTNRVARKLVKEDYNNYDYIIGMENSNIRNIIKIIGHDNKNKIYRLLDFSDNPRDIADPWYTGNFDETYDDIVEGCTALLDNIKKVENL